MVVIVDSVVTAVNNGQGSEMAGGVPRCGVPADVWEGVPSNSGTQGTSAPAPSSRRVQNMAICRGLSTYRAPGLYIRARRRDSILGVIVDPGGS